MEPRTFLVTGATSGLGLATAQALATPGHRVILGVRDVDSGRRIAARLPKADLDVRHLDLADLDDVHAFAERFRADHGRLDVLINNAGVMAPPRTLTRQGHELQFAVNHLGHFALTGLLLDLLAAGSDPRVVTVSSLNHRQGRIFFDDLAGERGYRAMAYYNQSKLANAMFGAELHRRLTASRSPVRSVLAHPGYVATGLQSGAKVVPRLLYGVLARPLAQKPEQGALSQLHAATAPDVRGGDFFGPRGRGELRGAPIRVRLSADAADPALGRRLWTVSEQLTGVRYGFAAEPTSAP